MTIRQIALAVALAIVIAPSAIAQQQGSQRPGGRFEQMQQMREQAHKTTDPAQRQRLMHDHMSMMQEQMQSMRGMMGQQGGMMGGNKEENMQKMQERMDMMQHMMEQMMGQQQMMMNGPHRKPGMQ